MLPENSSSGNIQESLEKMLSDKSLSSRIDDNYSYDSRDNYTNIISDIFYLKDNSNAQYYENFYN